MSETTIELPESKMRVMFRVIGQYTYLGASLLFSSENYESAESFCWQYDGNAQEVRIEKVWIKK